MTENKITPIYVELPSELHKRLKLEAVRQGKFLKELITDILEKGVQE